MHRGGSVSLARGGEPGTRYREEGGGVIHEPRRVTARAHLVWGRVDRDARRTCVGSRGARRDVRSRRAACTCAGSVFACCCLRRVRACLLRDLLVFDRCNVNVRRAGAARAIDLDTQGLPRLYCSLTLYRIRNPNPDSSALTAWCPSPQPSSPSW